MAKLLDIVLLTILIWTMRPACSTMITRLGLGVVLHREVPIQLQTNTWRHILLLPLPQRLLPVTLEDPCVEYEKARQEKRNGATNTSIPRVATVLCSSFKEIREFARTMNTSLYEDIDASLDTLYSVLLDAITSNTHTQNLSAMPPERVRRHT